jgi:hypothetical protein
VGSGSDTTVHFGLGSAPRVQRLEVTWPTGGRKVLRDVPADQRIEVREPTR